MEGSRNLDLLIGVGMNRLTLSLRWMTGLLLACVIHNPLAWGADTPVDYEKQIKPLLSHRCGICHGALKQEGSLRVDAGQLILKGGDSGTAIKPGDPKGSLLIHALRGTNDVTRMPADGKPLTEAEIVLFERWISEGAKYPTNEKIPENPRKHWAFQTPVRPAVPVPASKDFRIRNPIDAFVQVEREKRGLKPLPEASKNVLLRRLYLDLVGVPPTISELNAFLQDDSANAYEKVVDRLLDDPRHGQRWGRHWMDVWRYSDWYGYGSEVRNSALHIWRWRDWIVESLNADRPYNEMVIDMLAADEAAPTDLDRLRATGFLARNYFKFNRNIWLDFTVEHTSKAFLGTTMNCARCHDHLYDPISAKEYYSFRAIFEPHQIRSDYVPGQMNLEKDGLARAYDADLTVKTFLFKRGEESQPDTKNPLGPGVPSVLGGGAEFQVQPVVLPSEAFRPILRDYVQKQLRDEAVANLQSKETALASARKLVEMARTTPEAVPSQPKSEGKQQKVANSPAALDAAVKLREAERNVQLAERDVALAKAELEFVNTRIYADVARFSVKADGQPTHPDVVKSVSRKASLAERTITLRKAERELQVAENALSVAAAAMPKPTDAVLAPARTKVDSSKAAVTQATEALKKDSETYTSFPVVFRETSTGRRLALARWITDRKNPLAARVAVNQIWMRHFGKPIVSSVFEFGLHGTLPTHPALLDWLAVEFRDGSESGSTAAGPWRMKALHRLIVTSTTYRQSSGTAAASEASLMESNSKLDPDNIWLWRMNRRRMEAEVVRDSLFATAGHLDTKLGGPEIDQNLAASTNRRSLYYRHAPEKEAVFLKMFDSANTAECYRREETVVPQQALALVNSPLTLDQSRRLTTSIRNEIASLPPAEADREFVRRLYLRTLTREPTADELAACLKFLESQTRRLSDKANLVAFPGAVSTHVAPAADPAIRARENLAHVLLNHNEFVMIR